MPKAGKGKAAAENATVVSSDDPRIQDEITAREAVIAAEAERTAYYAANPKSPPKKES